MIIHALGICRWRGEWRLVGIVTIGRILGTIVVGLVALPSVVVIRHRKLVRWSGSRAPLPTEHWFVAKLDIRWSTCLRRNGDHSLPLSSSAQHHHEET